MLLVPNMPKGSWILHMLRGLLGQKYLERHQSILQKYKDLNTSTKDFKTIMEEV